MSTGKPVCCGACAHLAAAGGSPTPAAPPLLFELEPDGAPRGAVLELLTRPEPVKITRREVIVGRSKKSCDVAIPDRYLPLKTCKLSFDAQGRCFVTDLTKKGECGVVVGNRRVKRVGLHEGDRVYIGNTFFTVRRGP
jgi:hypothetical protein